ncbi:MAG: prepilin-type N-terminal cleavage/methylation domain-containing protein [Pseudomonadota bacterium]
MAGPRKRRGFTLIEVLVAAILVAFMLVASYQLFARTLLHHAHNTYVQRAVSICHGLSETLRVIDGLAPNLEADCAAGDIGACRRRDQVVRALTNHQSQTAAALPDGSLSTTRGGDGRLRITLSWSSGAPLTPGLYRMEIVP